MPRKTVISMDIIQRGPANENAGTVRKGRGTKSYAKVLAKSEIRAQALRILQLGGWNCWPQNNVRAVPGRKFVGRLGLPDIIGFNKFTGLFMVCEVKTVNDKLSDDQILFLTEVTNAHGLALIAHQDRNGSVLLTEFKDWIK
jgi:hypothetical protein